MENRIVQKCNYRQPKAKRSKIWKTSWNWCSNFWMERRRNA